MFRTTQRAPLRLRSILPEASFPSEAIPTIKAVCSDPHRCRPGDVYIPVLNAGEDGHDLADVAIANGAVLVIAERLVPASVPVVIVKDTRVALGRLSQALAGNPCQQLRTIAVAGSAGKTVTSILLASVLEKAKRTVGVTCSIGYSDSEEQVTASATTPKAPKLAQWLERMVTAGCQDGVVEISGKALAEKRLAGMEFDAFILHNLLRIGTDDGRPQISTALLEKNLLKLAKPGAFAVANADDEGIMALAGQLGMPVLTYGIHADAEITAEVLERHSSEQMFLLMAGNETVVVRTRIIGDAHISNCLAVTAVALTLGIDLATIVRGLEAVSHVPGRLERIEAGQPFSVYVDSAHTPEGLARTLKTIRQTTTGRVICLFGAPGEKNRQLRAMLGRVAERGSDLPIITSDNPRLEEPLQIAHDILDGFHKAAKARIRPNREQAIRWGLSLAQPGDSLVVVGAGDRTVQHIAGERVAHADGEVVRRLLHEAAQPEAAKPKFRVIG